MRKSAVSHRQLLTRAPLLSGLALLLLAGLPPYGQEMPLLGEEETEGLPEIRRYSVELIVFEYKESAPDDSEIFLPDDTETLSLEDLPTLDDAGIVPTFSDRGFADPVGPAGEAAGSRVSEDEAVAILPPELVTEEDRLEEIPIPRQQVNLFPLLPDEYTMNDIYDKLVELDAYVPLLHTGWSQTTPEQVDPPSIRLRAIGDPPLKLDGNLTLYLGRYLHLIVDLSMEQDAQTVDSSDDDTGVAAFGDLGGTMRYPLDPVRQEPLIRYRINEDRIVRSGELRYFDHPRFGVLARVLRIEEEVEEIEIRQDVRGLPGIQDSLGTRTPAN